MALVIDPQWQQRQEMSYTLRRDDHRDPYQRDRARILHSAAFRRLQAKTQIHDPSVNDFHRTRLTHSLEASQIGSGILFHLLHQQPEFEAILPSVALIESLCLAHDIGHPPFGHGGEIALNYMLRDQGGFEGNAQTFRIVTQLEPYTKDHGMNLARRSLLGLMKYPALLSHVRQEQLPETTPFTRQLKAHEWRPAKGLFDIDSDSVDFVLAPLSQSDKALFVSHSMPDNLYSHAKTRYKSLDCSIMELADDIAYGVHDLEDAIVLGVVQQSDWQKFAQTPLAKCGDAWFEKHINLISDKLFSGEHHLRKDAIGGLVNALLTQISIHKVDERFESNLLRYNAYLDKASQQALNILKQFVYQFVIHHHDIQIVEYRGQQIIIALFEAISSNPERLLPQSTQKKWQEAESELHQMRVISDYIAAMTDGYAEKLHRQLFVS